MPTSRKQYLQRKYTKLNGNIRRAKETASLLAEQYYPHYLDFADELDLLAYDLDRLLSRAEDIEDKKP